MMSQKTTLTLALPTPGVPRSQTTKGPLEARKLFAERMKREGRHRQFVQVIADVEAETGKPGRWAIWEAMRRMGYQSATVERKLYAEWEKLQHRTLAEAAIASVEQIKQLRKEDESREMEFEDAMSGLPNAAPPQEEWEWIGAHPAMSRLDRMTDKTRYIILTGDDVLKPPHGPSPSKRAARQLQHWCNCPKDFYKNLMVVQRKQQDGADGTSASMDDANQADVRKILEEFTRPFTTGTVPNVT